MNANDSSTHAEPTGHDEAVEVVARAIYATNPQQTGPEFDRRDPTWDEMVEEDEAEPYRIDARAGLAALSSAGFLATEQEWAIRTESGMVLDGARDQAYAERWAAGCTRTNGLTGEVRTGTAVAVSRRVTAWTEASS